MYDRKAFRSNHIYLTSIKAHFISFDSPTTLWSRQPIGKKWGDLKCAKLETNVKINLNFNRIVVQFFRCSSKQSFYKTGQIKIK